MDFSKSRELLAQAKQIRHDLAEKYPTPAFRDDYANALTYSGLASRDEALAATRQNKRELAEERLRAAAADLEEARDVRAALAQRDPRSFTVRLSDTLNSLASVYSIQKRWVDARTALETALTMLQSQVPDNGLQSIATTLVNTAILERLQGHTYEAKKKYEDALATFEKMPEQQRMRFQSEIESIKAMIENLRGHSDKQ